MPQERAAWRDSAQLCTVTIFFAPRKAYVSVTQAPPEDWVGAGRAFERAIAAPGMLLGQEVRLAG